VVSCSTSGVLRRYAGTPVRRYDGSMWLRRRRAASYLSHTWTHTCLAAPIGLGIANHPDLALVIQGKEKAGGGAMGIDLSCLIY
jgi:hypothetical protein